MTQHMAVAIPNRKTGKIDLVNYYELKEGDTGISWRNQRAADEKKPYSHCINGQGMESYQIHSINNKSRAGL